jgi:hypothetical protein
LVPPVSAADSLAVAPGWLPADPSDPRGSLPAWSAVLLRSAAVGLLPDSVTRVTGVACAGDCSGVLERRLVTATRGHLWTSSRLLLGSGGGDPSRPWLLHLCRRRAGGSSWIELCLPVGHQSGGGGLVTTGSAAVAPPRLCPVFGGSSGGTLRRSSPPRSVGNGWTLSADPGRPCHRQQAREWFLLDVSLPCCCCVSRVVAAASPPRLSRVALDRCSVDGWTQRHWRYVAGLLLLDFRLFAASSPRRLCPAAASPPLHPSLNAPRCWFVAAL